jgi:DNA-binding response OmpR family regulator
MRAIGVAAPVAALTVSENRTAALISWSVPNDHILVVDDDPKIRTLLRRCFEPEGYRVSEAGNGDEVLERLGQDGVDLVTLDLNLPGEDGLSLARRIRGVSDVPIIIVTGKGDAIDAIVGLEVGADDYIRKPFHVREVLARVRSVLRRARPAGALAAPAPRPPRSERLRFRDWIIDAAKRELQSTSGIICPLTTAEFDLLLLFVKRANRVLSRDEIMDLLRGHDWSPFDRSIDNLVARLRKKIELNGEAPGLIKTVRGVGYCFAADVAPA